MFGVETWEIPSLLVTTNQEDIDSVHVQALVIRKHKLFITWAVRNPEEECGFVFFSKGFNHEFSIFEK